MNRVVLAASFALQHYADKKLEAKFREALNKKGRGAERSRQLTLTPRTQLGF